MLEVRKNTFARNYENTFFRVFSKNLSKYFMEKGISGLLIGSPICEPDERLQIDALLITERVVCIIDFKNYSGLINLPGSNNFEFGIWTTNNGEQVKGGSSINPFIQLNNQKRRFSEVYEKYIKTNLKDDDIIDCRHIVNVVCFQKEIELNREIPNSKEMSFWIIDSVNFIEKISDIIDVNDKNTNISEQSYDAFRKVFNADIYKVEDKPVEDELHEIIEHSSKLDYSILYPDQKSALTEIKAFLENPEQQVFVLQGTANSGKSYLIPFIQDLAYNLRIQETEVFASSSRIANNLISIGRLERVNSIYSYIYGGKPRKYLKFWDDKDVEKMFEIIGDDYFNGNGAKVDIDDLREQFPYEIIFEAIPIKQNDNSDNSLFIVDESQLVSDSFNQSIDLIFGTGYLLKDFLSYTNLVNTKRKLIFIGDPFQLQLGKTDESPLNPLYLEEAYNLKTNAYQLLDKPDFSIINKEALFCVDKIRTRYFNSLKFEQNYDFKILSDDLEKENVIADLINSKKGHLLYFKNEDAQERNLKIKKDILKNGNCLAIGDLVVFNNNIETKSDNPDAFPKKILNGQFARITKISNDLRTESIFDNKGKFISNLSFVEVGIKHSESGYESTVLSFENYRNNPKAILSNNDLRAFRIFLYKLANKELENFISKKYNVDEVLSKLLIELDEGKKVKTKINERLQTILRTMPETEYYKFKNAALLRFGWAMTVHKSMSYKWDEVIFNVERTSKTNEDYFRWLYTGISRARKKVSLINYKRISPFDNTEFVDNNTANATNEFFYIAESQEKENRLTEFKEFVICKLVDTEIERIENLNWQERYHLKKENKRAIISFIYNGQGKFKFPTLSGGDNAFGKEIIEQLKSKNLKFDFRVIKDSWRITQYELLSNVLKQKNVFFSQIIQTNYKDKIKLFSIGNEELDIEIDYNGDGAFSKITAKYYSNVTIWDNFKKAVEEL